MNHPEITSPPPFFLPLFFFLKPPFYSVVFSPLIHSPSPPFFFNVHPQIVSSKDGFPSFPFIPHKPLLH